MRRDDATILVGTGFDTIYRSGKAYPTFPDMRLIVSEKDHLQAWVITDTSIDVNLFQSILPTLGFPPIYASRSIIAKFRDTITDTSFLDQCRFFELFADGGPSRKIGNYEFLTRSSDAAAHLAIATVSGEIVLGWTSLETSADTSAKGTDIITKSDTQFALGDLSFSSGEIIMFRWKNREKHTLKFTFDTFFVDIGSIGVVAWYTLGDRELLGQNGVLIFTLEEDVRSRMIMGHIFIDSRGFVHAHEMMAVHKEILKWIRATYEKLILENDRIERGTLVQSLRREITKYCYLLTGRTPVVMPVIIER
jgi:Ribonuclease J C-terminal domain